MNKPLQQSISLLYILKTSIFTSIGMIGFFFLMAILNLHTIFELRYLNFFFVFFGARQVILHRQTIHPGKVKFHPAMMIGFVTVLFTAVLFSTFVFIYFNLDPAFMTLLKQSRPFGAYLSPASCALVTYLEGIVSGAIVSLPVLLTMKRERVTASEPISQLAN